MATILIAEDDSSMRDFLTTALRKVGHDVESKPDGIQALSELSKKPYDLLLADIVMPGMDGVELATRATDQNPKMKVMFITGFAAVAMDNKNPLKNSATVLSKPFHLNDLVHEVEKILAA